MYGSRRLIGSGVLEALAPGPSSSELLPGPETFHGSLPETTEASPFSVQPLAPFSKPWLANAQYAALSPRAENACVVVPHGGSRRLVTPESNPADALGTPTPITAAAAARTSPIRKTLPLMSIPFKPAGTSGPTVNRTSWPGVTQERDAIPSNGGFCRGTQASPEGLPIMCR